MIVTVRTRCPGCAETQEGPVGAATRCPSCSADFWLVANADTGAPFGAVTEPPPGWALTLWSVVAAAGVLVAFLTLIAIEIYGVVWLIRWTAR